MKRYHQVLVKISSLKSERAQEILGKLGPAGYRIVMRLDEFVIFEKEVESKKDSDSK